MSWWRESRFPVNLDFELRVQKLLVDTIGRGWIQSAHDCSEGGLLVTALECALTAQLGLGFELSAGESDPAHKAFLAKVRHAYWQP